MLCQNRSASGGFAPDPLPRSLLLDPSEGSAPDPYYRLAPHALAICSRPLSPPLLGVKLRLLIRWVLTSLRVRPALPKDLCHRPVLAAKHQNHIGLLHYHTALLLAFHISTLHRNYLSNTETERYHSISNGNTRPVDTGSMYPPLDLNTGSESH